MMIFKSILSGRDVSLPKLLLTPVLLLTALFSEATITISSFPTPQTREICDLSASNFLLPIVATTNCGSSSSAISYQWYLNGSSLGTSGTGYTSANTSTLNVTNHSTMGLSNGDVLRVILTETGVGCTDIDTLDFPIRLVSNVPSISLTADQTVCDGATVEWEVDVTAPNPTGELTFEWYRRPDGGSYPGTPNVTQERGSGAPTIDTSYSYVTSMGLDQEDIKVEVTNICGTTVSPDRTLSMVPVPNLTPGTDITVCTSSSSGTSISYTVTDASYDPSTGGSVDWETSVSVSGTDPTSVSALNTLFSGGNLTGTGNGVTTLSLPSLNPGTYEVEFTSIKETSAPTPPECTRSLTNQKIDITVYPEPTVSWSTTTVDACEGDGGSFSLDVTNAEYGSPATGVNWQVTFTQSSGNTFTSCASGFNAGILPGNASGGTVNGNGNGSTNYTIPTSLPPGVYTYTLTNITNTSNTCTAASPVTGGATLTINIYPKPEITVTPVVSNVCEGDAGSFTVEVSNTDYCTSVGSSASASWSAPYTDATGSTLPGSPYTGTGDVGPTTFNTSAALSPGSYTMTFSSIDNTTAGTAGSTCGPVTLTANNEYTVTVNPEPTVSSFAASSATICEGTSGETVDLTIANAEIGGTPQNWQITFTDKSGDVTNNCAASSTTANIFPTPWTGSGNGTTSYNIPTTLGPGFYEFEITNVQNTSGPGSGCTAGTVSHTATFEIYPVAEIVFSPNVKEKCENDAGETFQYTIENNERCNGTGSGTTDVSSTFTVVDNVTGTGLTSVSGTGNSPSAVSLGIDATLAVGDHTFTATAVNSGSGTCTKTINEVMTITVEPRPEAYFPTENIYLCEGSLGSFDINVDNDMLKGSGVQVTLDYTENSAVASSNCVSGSASPDIIGEGGSFTLTGSASSTFKSVTIPATLSPGLYTYTLTQVVNDDGPCTGTIASTTGFSTINIFVYPVPDVDITPTRDSICENGTTTFNVSVSNIAYCTSIGSTSEAPWEFDFSDGVDSDIASQLTVAGSTAEGTGTAATTLTANSTSSLTEGIKNFSISSVRTRTLTGLTSQCARSVSDSYQLDVHPEPVVSWVSTSVSVCEGETDDIEIEVTNAEFDGNPVNWTITMTESSGNLSTSCNTGATAGMGITPSISGNGNKVGAGVLSYSIPNTLQAGIYTFTITGITNTQNGCTGTISGGATVTIYVNPQPTVTLSPTSAEICQGNNTTDFTITVVNAEYCSAIGAATGNADWEINITDNVESNIVSNPLANSGNSSVTVTANSLTPPGLAAGVYTFTMDDIQNTTGGPYGCASPETLTTNNEFELTVNAAPEVEFDQSLVTVCEGDADSLSYTVTNAAGVDWSISATEENGVIPNSCASATFSGTFTGTGNSTNWLPINSALPPGVYVLTLNSISNTTDGCPGSVGATNSVTVRVYPRPTFTIVQSDVTVCENTTETFDVEVDNAQYCASIGGSPTNVNWTWTKGTDNANSTMPASQSGSGNKTGASAYTYLVNLGTSLTAGDYIVVADEIENTTHSCVNTTDETLNVHVDDLPELTITYPTNGVEVCEGETVEFVYNVSGVGATDDWEFEYNIGTGNNLIQGTGPVTGSTFTSPAFNTTGSVTVTFTNTENTTTGCIENSAHPNITLNVLPLPDVTFGQINGGVSDICSGDDLDIDVTISNSAGKDWKITYSIDDTTRTSGGGTNSFTGEWTGTGNGTFTNSIPDQFWLNASGGADTREITIEKIEWTNDTVCENTATTFTGPISFDVFPLPVIDIVSPARVCINETATVNYTLSHVGSGETWTFTWSTTNPTDGPNTESDTEPTLTGSFTTNQLAPVGESTVIINSLTNNSTGCTNSDLPTDTIIVDPPSIAGTLSPNWTVCEDESGPFTITLTGKTGDVVAWDSSDNNGFTWYPIASTDTFRVIRFPDLNDWHYRVRVQQGACAPDTSNQVRFQVYKKPTFDVTAYTDNICAGSDVSFTLNVDVGSGSQDWTILYDYSGPSSATNQTITGKGSSAAVNETLSGLSAGTYTFTFKKITNDNTGCDTTYTTTKTVVITSPPTAGSVSPTSATLCNGSNANVTWSGGTGNVDRWEVSTDMGANWATLTGATSNSISYQNVMDTTWIRAIIKNAPCTSEVTSPIAKFDVLSANPAAEFVNLNSSYTYCKGATAPTFSIGVTGTGGASWTITINEGDSTGITRTGTGNDTITYTPVQPNAMDESFDVVIQKIEITSGSATCSKFLGNTSTVNVDIIEDVVATITSAPSQQCEGGTVDFTVNISGIASGENWTLNYTLDGNAQTAATGTGPGNFTITTTDNLNNTGSTQTNVTLALTDITNNSLPNSAGGYCTTSLSSSRTIAVDPTTVGGSASGTATVCKGDNTGTVTVSGHTGSVTKWQASTDGGTTWTDINSSASTTYTYNNLTVETMYRAVVKSGECAEAMSSSVTISIQDLPTASIDNTDPTKVCYDGTVDVDVTLGNIVTGGSGTDWTLTYTVNNVTGTLDGSGSSGTITLNNITVDSEVELVSIAPRGASGMKCSNMNLSDKLEIVVIETPNVTVTSYDDTLCNGSNASVTINVNSIGTADNFRVYYRLTSTGSTNTWNGTGSGSHTFTVADAVANTGSAVITQNILIDSIRNLSNTPTTGVACTESLGITAGIAVYPDSDGGTASGTATVCNGDNSGTVTVSGNVGDVIKWQYSTNGGTTWNDIFNSASTSYTYTNLTVETIYRAVVQSGPCASDNSTSVTISIQDLPTASIDNTDPTKVCYDGTVDVDVTLGNIVPTGNDWTLTYTVNNVTGTLDGSGSAGTITLNNITVDSEVELVSIAPRGASGIQCSNMNLSDKLEIVVIETPNVTVTSYDDSLCTGEQPVVDLSVTSIGTGDNFQIWYRLTSTGTTRSWTGTGSGSHTFTVADAVSNTGSAVITQNILIDSIRNLSNTPTTGVACTESLGISAGVSVYPASEGGDATGTATVCNGFNQGTVSVVNQVGDVVKWQYRVGTGGWTDIFNSDTTDYVYNNLSVETEFRAIVQSGPCSEAASNPVTISIQPLPIVTINNTDPTKVCKGNDVELSFEVSNVANGGSGTDWTITYTLNNVTQTLDGSGNGTKTVDFTGVLVDTEVELIKIESRGVNGMQCDNLDLSDKLQVKVIENPILTISGHSDTLCNGSKPSVDVNISGISSSDRFRVFYKLGATGASRTYENKGPGNYTINFVDAVTNNGSTVITETLYIDSVRNIDDVPSAGDLCTGLLGLTRDVDVYPNSVGGDATGDAIVCKDENSGWVEVVNLVGNVVKWQYKEAGGSWTDIFNTDTIAYMYENLSVETRFRAIVKSGPCTEATSTDALIEIRELPEVSINNTDPTYVCYGGSITLSVDVTKVGAGSSGSDWTINYTINGVAASFDGSGNGTATTTISNITADAEIELVSIVSRGAAGMQCNNRDLSDKLEVKVIENPTASISSVESPVCHGETVDFKVEVSNVGTSENWSLVYKLGSGGSNRTLTGTGAGIFAFTTTDLVSNTGTTSNTTDIILVSIENTTNQPTSGANCSSTLSDSESVTVFPETVGGTTSGTATVCKGDNTGWVTLSGHVGDVVKWQSSTNNGVTWSDIANTNDSLQFTNVSVETQYRAVVMSGPCDEETSSTVTISIKELPTVTIVNNTFNVCDGSTATINYFLGNVDAGQTWAITYKVNGTTQSTDLTGTGPGSSSNPFSLTIGPLNSTTDVEFVNVRTTSGDPQCDNAITEKATVTVLDNPSASITSDNDTICEGGNGIVKINVDNVKNGERWILTYDDGVNTNVTKDGFGPGSFTFTTPTLNTAGTYKFKLNSIVNASLNPSCSKTLADSVDIIVDQETEGGTVTPATSSVCLGDNTGILTWNPGVGDIVRWEYSDDGGNTWNNLANNTTTLTYNDIEKTTMYRVYVRSGVCAGKYSTVATVTVLDQPVATISGAPKVCPNTPAVFTLTVSDVPAGEGWTVTFLENGAQRTTTGTGSGTFTLTTRGYPYTTTPSTITVSLEEIRNDVSGCVNDDLNSSAIATITPNPVPAFDAENACQDTLVVFDNKSAIAEGAISGYVWYFGDGDSSKAVSPTHAYDNAGAYRVRLVAISDNGCIAETEKVIDIYHNPTADFTFTNVCQNRDFMPVDASTVGGGSITDWMWRFGDLNTSTDQNPTHRYASSGTYDVTLKVTTDNGCTDEVSKEATIYILPEASFVAQPVCEDDEMDFINTSAIGYGTMTYEWDFDNDGTTNSTATNPGHTFTGTPSFGDFDVQMVATSNNGCRDTTVRTVTVYANPVADFIADRVCFGETTNFGSRAFVPSPSTDIIVEYFWDFADTSFSTGKDPSHTYDRPNENGYGVTLRVVTDKGCEDSETKDVVVDELPEFDLTATPNPICDGDSSVIEVTNASTTLTEFNWNTGATTSSIVARTQGTYSVIVTEDPALGGCQAADSVFLEVWPLPAVDAGRDTTINKGQVVQLMGQPDNMATYTWTPADVLDLPNDQNPITVGESVAGFNQGMMETTTFTLVVEDANGCSNTDDVTVTVLDEFSLIVYNLVTPNFDGDNDTWIIENILAYPEAEVAIFNRYGMEVFKTTGYQNTWDGKYEGKNLPDGAYYYVITIPGGTDSKATVYKGAINLVRTTN